MEANTLHRIGGEESWGKERSPRAQKVYKEWSENTDASRRDEAGFMPQTQTPGHMATRESDVEDQQHKPEQWCGLLNSALRRQREEDFHEFQASPL